MGKKSKKSASHQPGNDIISTLHNKWRYYSRKNKNLPKIIAFSAILLVFFILKSSVLHKQRDFSAGYIRDNTNDPEYLTDEEGNVVLDESGNPVVVNQPDESMPEEEGLSEESEAIDEENAVSESTTVEKGFFASLIDINKLFSLRARLREWWTGDNPGYRLVSPLSVPIPDRKYDFDSDFLAVS